MHAAGHVIMRTIVHSYMHQLHATGRGRSSSSMHHMCHAMFGDYSARPGGGDERGARPRARGRAGARYAVRPYENKRHRMVVSNPPGRFAHLLAGTV